MGRSAQDTRRALLTAAGDAIRAKGVHASLDDIARQAGVSKGGLIYHFASKEELVLELARDLFTAFRTDITRQLDPNDSTPGRLTRAYLRTLRNPAEDETAAREAIALVTQLMTIPAVADLARREAEALQAELDADGLPPDVLALVISAADGISSAPSGEPPPTLPSTPNSSAASPRSPANPTCGRSWAGPDLDVHAELAPWPKQPAVVLLQLPLGLARRALGSDLAAGGTRRSSERLLSGLSSTSRLRGGGCGRSGSRTAPSAPRAGASATARRSLPPAGLALAAT
jgi:AcrR family transcriptional regulator